MSFCPNCGAKLADGMKFCTECGTKLAAPAPVEPVYETPVPAEPVYEAPAAPVYEEPAPAAPVCEAPAAPVFEEPAPAAPVYEAPVQQTYAPPVQQSYEPPVQSYTPPVQAPTSGSYTPPVQTPTSGSYTPPVQAGTGGSYTPPPAPPKAEKPVKAPKEPKAPKAPKEPKAPREKKPGNKKLIPIIAGVAVLVVLLIVLLVSCGGKDQGTEADWGVYEGVSCVVSGMDLGADGEWVELQKKGKATLCIMGSEYSAKWTLDGENIVIKQGGDEFAGTLKNGVLEVDMAGMLYTFQKPGAAAAPGNSGAAQLPGKDDKAPEQANGPVTYKLVSASVDGEEMPAEVLEMMGGGWIIFNGDGTGTFALFGENNPITYDGTHMMAGDEKIAYTLTDGGMEFAMDDGSAFVLEVTDETPVLPEPGGEEEPEVPEEPEDDPGVPADSGLQLWAGDYYGYWIVDTVWETQQDWLVEGAYWDCCASVEINPDGTGTMIIWDEDYTKDDPLAELDITVSETGSVARFCGEEGQFLGGPLEHADWLWYTDDTEYGDMFMIEGMYEDEVDDFWYCIYLRPWGVDWSDVEANDEQTPYYYYDWYLPMVEDGVTEAPVGYVAE